MSARSWPTTSFLKSIAEIFLPMTSKQPPADSALQDSEVFQKLLRETGKIDWASLAPHYESGGLVLVDSELDLVRVAYGFAEDEKESVARWLQQGQVTKVEAEQVEEWNRSKPEFWAVVVAPWVLIQPA